LKNKKFTEILIYLSVFTFHFLVLFLISLAVKDRINSVNYFQDIELVNIQEFKQQQQQKKSVQPRVEEGMKEETDDKVKQPDSQGNSNDDSNYVGQFNAAIAPVFPMNYIKSRVIYPPLAKEQGIQNVVVILELLVDKTGEIKKVNVLKDPGFGFAEAAVKGFQGVKVTPAKDPGGNPISIRFRFPFRFVLN
jgi:periplasmic protein TonB